MEKTFSIFLCGDVMTGRGIDQILPFSCNPILYETYVKDAREYIYLAEEKNGKINYPVNMSYIWGDALSVWKEFKPSIKIINLETAITQCDDYWPRKVINYRMHPCNIEIFNIAGINVCTLANNHILDWGYDGLKETLVILKKSNILFSGAGNTLTEAMQPAIFKLPQNKRILIFSVGTESAGVPDIWRAEKDRSGIYTIHFDLNSLNDIATNINKYKTSNDIVILSIHWGSNWGYEVQEEFQSFAHGLIDEAKVDIVFGHSSHHFRPIEIYHHKLIFYGCGDFINDYEGISGYEEFRDDLSIMYFIEFELSSMQIIKLQLVPMKIKNFRLKRASNDESDWVLTKFNQFHFSVKFNMQNNVLVSYL